MTHDDPTTDNPEPPHWRPRHRPSLLSQISRLLLLSVIVLMLIIPFTPLAGRIKQGLKEIAEAARARRVVLVPKEVTKEVRVPHEVVREVVREVKVPVEQPPPPLPDQFIPRKEVDVATLFNGITIKTNLVAEQGTFASLERLDPRAYQAEFQLTVRVPKANQSLSELARINKNLPNMLPDLDDMLPQAKVSGFYHKLYENKTNGIKRDLTRLSRILDRHNFFDCETILELTHPSSSRRVLLIQSEMDVVADGSDGDRMPTLDEYIYLSDYYQPFTSYAWAKRTKTPNPLLARWEERLKAAKDQFAQKGLSAERNRELKALISQLEIEIREMKNRSSLIAEKDPFIVLSLLFRGYSAQNKHTPRMGDYAVVIHEGKMYPAICGDYGPTQKMGEASLFIAKAVNPSATPYRRPESDLKVTYLIFPGTAEQTPAPPNLEFYHQRCAALLAEVGAPGAGYELHRWEDPFKKPEPPPVPGGSQPQAPATPGTTNPATSGDDLTTGVAAPKSAPEAAVSALPAATPPAAPAGAVATPVAPGALVPAASPASQNLAPAPPDAAAPTGPGNATGQAGSPKSATGH